VKCLILELLLLSRMVSYPDGNIFVVDIGGVSMAFVQAAVVPIHANVPYFHAVFYVVRFDTL
jgi:hypothetical protein